jgi:hypothetical protein
VLSVIIRVGHTLDAVWIICASHQLQLQSMELEVGVAMRSLEETMAVSKVTGITQYDSGVTGLH